MSPPAQHSRFVGRSGELVALVAAVARNRLVTVVGPGGVGKSRLAVEALPRLPPALHGFAELGASGPADLAGAVLAACGLREEPGRAALEVARDRLGRAAGLLVLDCCEHVRAEAAALAHDLLRGCPDLRVLATSRVALGLAGETVLPLEGLAPDDGGAALLLDRARAGQPELPDGPDAEGLAAEICLLADGLPLAIELAAAHARTLPLTAIRDGMADRLRFLARHPGADRRHSLRSSLDWSAGLVGAPARTALGALSVLDGWFPLDVALAVTGDPAAVPALVEHSLLRFDAAGGRYQLPDTVREYAAATAEPEVTTAARGRLLDWARHFARTARVGLEHADREALARVEEADAAVRSALSAPPDPGVAAEVVADLTFGWSLRGRAGDGLALAERVAAALDAPPAGLRWAHAFLTFYSGALETGYGLAAAALDDELLDGSARSRSMILVGMAQAFADPAGAEPVLAEAGRLAAVAGDDWAVVEAAQCRACTHQFRGAPAAAVACLDEVGPVLDRLGHGQLLAWDYAIRADAAGTSGDHRAAAALGARGVELAVAVGEPVSAAAALVALVRALVAVGDRDAAADVLTRGLRFLDTHPGLGTAETACVATAIVASADGAERAASAARAALDAGGDLPVVAAEAGILLATALLRAGDAAAAGAAAAAAGDTAATLGHRAYATAAGLVGAAARRAAGADPQGAHDLLATATGLGLRPLVLDGLDLVARLARDGGRDAVAARLHAAAARHRDEAGAAVSPLAALLVPEPAFARSTGLAEARAEGARLGLTGAAGYAVRNRGRRGRPRSGWASLTPAELSVVALVARGMSNPRIADELLVSPGTVRTHLRSVFAKLGVTNRTELAAAAAVRDA